MANIIPGVFLGNTLVQKATSGGKGKGVFVPLEGQSQYQFPTYGGVIANPFKGAAKLFAGDLAEFRTDGNGYNGKYYILKTYQVVSASGTTVNVLRGGFYHIPFVGDVLMIAPDTIGGTGTAATVTAVTATTVTVSSKTYEVWQLTTSANLSASANDILVEAEEAGNDKAMVVKAINSVAPCDYDMVYDPSTTFGSDNDTDTNARYFVSLVLGGTMYTHKMSPLPECVKKLNRSEVNGWFCVSWNNTNSGIAASVGDNTVGVSSSYSASAPTTATVGKVGDIITNGSYIYVCTAAGETYTWKKVAIA